MKILKRKETFLKLVSSYKRLVHRENMELFQKEMVVTKEKSNTFMTENPLSNNTLLPKSKSMLSKYSKYLLKYPNTDCQNVVFLYI